MRFRVLLLAACLGFVTATVWAAAPGFQAGAATSNITPPLGGGIIGGFLPIPSKHVHDELHARCLVLDDGKTRLAMVVCDLLGLHVQLCQQARAGIEAECHIPADHVFLVATHTHSATSALGQSRYQSEQKLDEYQQFVVRRIVDGTRRAMNLLRPAEFAFVTAQAPEHVFNRRWFMTPGKVPVNPFGGIDQVKMNPPGGSPDLVKPAGPTDPTVSILAFRQPDGQPIAVYSSYSLHYIGGVGPGHISADYYGMYCREVERQLDQRRQDPPPVVLMSNGTSGDINNVDFRQPRPKREPYEQIRRVADSVAEKVVAALGSAKYRSDVTLAGRFRQPRLAWRKPTAEEMAWAKKRLEGPAPEAGKTDLPWIYAERTLRVSELPADGPVPLQVLRIGDVCVGTMPCEVFCEIGLEFKRRCPIQPALLVSLAHGYLGYLPTPRQHELGGYETWLGTSRLEKSASDTLLAELLAMAAEVRPAGVKP